MSILQHRFGQTTIAKVRNSTELRQVLDDPWFQSETIIIKPNWVSTEPGGFTEADTLRMLFEALDSKIVVTESLHIGRSMNLLKHGKSFRVGNKNVTWNWLLRGDGWNWLIENPDWNWFKEEGHWEHIKREDKAFLDIQGFTDLFEEFDVQYINVTDEVWNGRFADPMEIQTAVEAQYTPVHDTRLYSMVPQKLYDLKGSTFISLARLKQYATFTLKNVFGMIADPMRPWWHGRQHTKIATSIVDINKVYHTLFNIYGICEALGPTAVSHPTGTFQGVYMGKYNIIDGLEIVVLGRDLVALDSMLLDLTEPWIRIDEKINREPITVAEREKLGIPNTTVFKAVQSKVGTWFSPLTNMRV